MGNQQNKSFMSENVDLTHFKLCRSIGRGSFGKVRIIEHKITNKKYALKYFSKEDLIRRKMSKNIVRERTMLEGLSHAFVCNLRYAFQDDYNLYMGLDLMLGGDFRFHLQRRKFTEDELIFLAAEIASGIGYLHSKNIVHRDIKPDNVLLDERGHAHLTDFNIAAYIQPNHLLKSQSGTAQYMAPEMVANKGYSYGVDWWSLGITFYECIYGKTPFYDSIKKSKKKECIIEQYIDYSVHTLLDLSPLFFEFIKKLLNKDPKLRLGSGKNGFFSIQRLPLFNGIEWELLEKKMLRPPFCPSAEKHNFDMTYDLEELLLEDYPLESLPTKRSKDPKKMSVDMLYLENYFKNYDFYEEPKTRRHSDELNVAPKNKETLKDDITLVNKQVDDDEDTLGVLNSQPQSIETQDKQFRRRSRSLMNLYEKGNQELAKMEAKVLKPKEVIHEPKEVISRPKEVVTIPKIELLAISPRPSTSSDNSAMSRTETSSRDNLSSNRSSLKKLFFGNTKKSNSKRDNQLFPSEYSGEDLISKYY